MTTLWIICGAGSGVGKTRLALALCRVLPKAVYVKCGCGKPAAGKAENYFTNTKEAVAFIDARKGYEHIVLENNSLTLKGYGDIVIFIDAVPNRTDMRPDVASLRRRADIVVGAGTDSREWEIALREPPGDSRMRRNICRLLSEQKKFILKYGNKQWEKKN